MKKIPYIIYFLLVAALVWAADYEANQKIDGLADVSGSLTTSAKIPVQDMVTTDKTGIATIQQIFNTVLASTHDTAAELDALYEAELDNSAGLLAALSDETGTGVAVFGTAPTIATPVMTLDGIMESGDSVTVTAAEASNTVITNQGWDGNNDQTFTLPDIDSNDGNVVYKFTLLIVDVNTADVFIDPEGTTTNIYLDKEAIGDGERVQLAAPAVGDAITCLSASTDGSTSDWFCNTIAGVWTDAGS